MDYSTDSQDFCGNTPPGVSDCRKLVKNILSQKLFVGEYAARRYVDQLGDYRDVIVCNERETDLIKFLQAIQKIVTTEYENRKWLGITRNTETKDQNGYCLWVKLEELPFGKHWFQVRSVKFREKEIYLQLKYLRPYQAEEKKLDVEEFMTVNFREICTLGNLCEASKFSMVLILTIATCIVKGGAFFLDFMVKMTHELSILIHSLTPVMITVMNTIAKCIGGFYWLIFMLWRGNSVQAAKQVPVYDNRLAISRRSINTNPWPSERKKSGREW